MTTIRIFTQKLKVRYNFGRIIKDVKDRYDVPGTPRNSKVFSQ